MKLIVSVQGYTLPTTQEIADKCLKSGAVGIRTDQPIKIDNMLIGLVKDMDYANYITPTIDYINQVHEWGGLVAIDCRSSNENMSKLLKHCNDNQIEFIADIENYKDFAKVYAYEPAAIATTFSFLETGKAEVELINKIRQLTDIEIIAEGGYSDIMSLKLAKQYGANYVCIGMGITEIEKITGVYSDICN